MTRENIESMEHHLEHVDLPLKTRPQGQLKYIGPIKQHIQVRTPHFRQRLQAPSKTLLPIIAVDPGGTTGYSLLVLPKTIDGVDVFAWPLPKILENNVGWEHGEIPTFGNEDEAVYTLFKIIDRWPGAAVVVEDFILRAERKEKSRELLSPVRITAKLETWLWRYGKSMFLQQPGLTKPIVTDERLRLLGCKANDGMPDHARDADRHAVMFVRRCMGPSGTAIKCSAWPHLYPGTEEK